MHLCFYDNEVAHTSIKGPHSLSVDSHMRTTFGQSCDRPSYLFITWCVLTWEQGEGHRVDAVLLGCGCALCVGDIHLKFDWLLEDCRARCGLVLCSKTGLRDHTVAQTRDLEGKEKTKSVNRKSQNGLRGWHTKKRRDYTWEALMLKFSPTPCKWQAE